LTGPIGESKKTSFLLSLEWDKDNNQPRWWPPAKQRGHQRKCTSGDAALFWLWARLSRLQRQRFTSGSDTPSSIKATITWAPGQCASGSGDEHEILGARDQRQLPAHFLSEVGEQLQFLVGHYDVPTFSLNENPQIVVSGFFTGRRRAGRCEGGRSITSTDRVSYLRERQSPCCRRGPFRISAAGHRRLHKYGGTYTFANLADFQANKPGTFLMQKGMVMLIFWTSAVRVYRGHDSPEAEFVSFARGALLLQNYFHDDPNNLGSALRVCLGAHKKQQDGPSRWRGNVFRPLGPAADWRFAALSTA